MSDDVGSQLRGTPTRVRRGFVVALAWVLALLATSLLDQWIWRNCMVHNPRVFVTDTYHFLRQAGFLPVWVALGVSMWLIERRPRRGVLIMLSAALSGAAAELAKTLIQRLRPGATGEYLFGWSLRGLDTPGAEALLRTGYGTVSSHAAVAFGAAFMLMYLFPRAAVIPLGLAVGCAATRLISGVHFASDIVAAAGCAYGISRLLIRAYAPDRSLECSPPARVV